MIWFMISPALASDPGLEIHLPEPVVIDWDEAAQIALRDCRPGHEVTLMVYKMAMVGIEAQKLRLTLLRTRDWGLPDYGNRLFAAYGWLLTDDQRIGVVNTLQVTANNLTLAAAGLQARLDDSNLSAAALVLMSDDQGRLHGHLRQKGIEACTADRLLTLHVMVDAETVFVGELANLQALNADLERRETASADAP
jgi:hypothetical protein